MKKLIFCMEPWCSFCSELEPVLESIKNQIPIEKINLEYNPENAQRLNVTSIPTVILVEDGKELRRFVGSKNVNQVINFLNG